MRNNSTRHEKQPLLFKFHVKSSHCKRNANCTTYNASELEPFCDMIQNMILNYLVTYPLGKIQFKLSWNIAEHFWMTRKLKNFITGLDGLFRLSVKEGGCLIDENNAYHFTDMDYKQYAVSVTNKHIDKNVDHANRWEVDCRYCCNTPW
eukprot:UN07825